MLAFALMVAALPVSPMQARDGARPRLTMAVVPRICIEPCRVNIVVRVPPDDANRGLLVEAESVEFFRSSALQLDGRASRARHRVELGNLPAGRYVVRVTVDRVDTHVLVVTSQFRVFARGQPLPRSRYGASNDVQFWTRTTALPASASESTRKRRPSGVTTYELR